MVKQQTQLNSIYCLLIDYLDAPDTVLEQRCADLLLFSQGLSNGADAYLLLTVSPHPLIYVAENSLLLAQLQVGLRQVQMIGELQRQNEQLLAMTRTDALTQLHNRYAMQAELPVKIQQARANDEPQSLIILDVDYFRYVNNNYGHLVGDGVLQILAMRLQNHLRSEDTIFRYGGEEFVIILSNTDAVMVREIADRLRVLIASQPISIEESLSINITISLGTATLKPTDDAQGVSLLQRADRYLLQAKAAGRNQVLSD